MDYYLEEGPEDFEAGIIIIGVSIVTSNMMIQNSEKNAPTAASTYNIPQHDIANHLGLL